MKVKCQCLSWFVGALLLSLDLYILHIESWNYHIEPHEHEHEQSEASTHTLSSVCRLALFSLDLYQHNGSWNHHTEEHEH